MGAAPEGLGLLLLLTSLRYCIWEARIPFEIWVDLSPAPGMGGSLHLTWSPGEPDSPLCP